MDFVAYTLSKGEDLAISNWLLFNCVNISYNELIYALSHTYVRVIFHYNHDVIFTQVTQVALVSHHTFYYCE